MERMFYSATDLIKTLEIGMFQVLITWGNVLWVSI